jgi:tRNA(fMet)-specific endonuclease VapC
MDPKYLLDTNICIYIRRNYPLNVRTRFLELQRGEAAVSVVTYAELFYGAERMLDRVRAIEALEEFAGSIPVLPMPVEAARAYGAIRAHLAVRGELIGSNDIWIAAHARALDMTVVTNNEREFKRVTGLRVENWVAGVSR